MSKKTLATPAFAASVLGLAACGANSSQKIDVATTDFKFAPTSWTVAAGKPVALTLKNSGALKHEWVLLKKGMDGYVAFR